MSEAIGFFVGTQERGRNSRGKRVISVRATEVLLNDGSFYQFGATVLTNDFYCAKLK